MRAIPFNLLTLSQRATRLWAALAGLLLLGLNVHAAVALLEAERAWRIAAEMLEGERGENGGAGDDEHDSAHYHHRPRRQRDHRFA
jgi:hypothetical protein